MGLIFSARFACAQSVLAGLSAASPSLDRLLLCLAVLCTVFGFTLRFELARLPAAGGPCGWRSIALRGSRCHQGLQVVD